MDGWMDWAIHCMNDYCFPAAAIGYETVVSPYWSHALQIWALTTLPEVIECPDLL